MTILFSVTLVLVGGYLSGEFVQRLRLPGLLGMMIFGILIGPDGLDLLGVEFLEQAPNISVLALMIVITSSVFAIDIEALWKSRAVVGLVGTIPGILEGFAIMVAAMAFLDFTWSQGGILGFTIAIVSPAVIVPTMIRLKETGWGMDKGIPVIALAATNLDGLMAVILWLVFMTIELGSGDLTSVVGTAIGQIVLGIIWGGVVGVVVTYLYDRLLQSAASWLRTVVFLVLSAFVFFSGQILPINSPMALLVFGLYVVNTTKADIRQVGYVVKKLWMVGAILLFVSIGAISDLSLIKQVGLTGIVIIMIGVMARIGGAYIALNMTSGKLTPQEKLFIGLSTLGKATVQATLGPLVITYKVINGETILAIAVMSILVMAPAATLAIEFTYKRLLVQVTQEIRANHHPKE